MSKAIAIVGLSLSPILLSLPAGAATCGSLSSLKLANTTITSAQSVPAGAFVPLGPAPIAAALAAFKSLPAFCRVQGVIQPSGDSHIEFEVWLPMSGWNRDYMGVDNGAWPAASSTLLARGFRQHPWNGPRVS